MYNADTIFKNFEYICIIKYLYYCLLYINIYINKLNRGIEMSARSIIAMILITIGVIVLAIALTISITDFMLSLLVVPVGVVFLILGSTLLGVINRTWGV